MKIGLATKSAPRVVALTAMMLILGVSGVQDGIVLCFGDDGHVAIETVGPEGCAEAAETADHAASSRVVSVSSSHCGPCVDVAFTSSSATKGLEVAKRTLAAQAAISLVELRPPLPDLRARAPYQHATPFVSEKPHTVVLRC